jgi:amino-acid N-acetyltransferase
MSSITQPTLTQPTSAAPQLRPARVADEQIAALINSYAVQGLMLPKTHAQLYNHVRDFIVVEAAGTIVGCAGLKITWRDLAEIVSLAVAPAWQGRGLGRRLCEPLIADARTLGICTVFALTYQVDFFAKLGFTVVPKTTLSQKVWQDCQFCAKQDCCDEVAMILTLT